MRVRLYTIVWIHAVSRVAVSHIVVVHKYTLKFLLDLEALALMRVGILGACNILGIMGACGRSAVTGWVFECGSDEFQALWMKLWTLTGMKPLIWILTIATWVRLLGAIWIVSEGLGWVPGNVWTILLAGFASTPRLVEGISAAVYWAVFEEGWVVQRLLHRAQVVFHSVSKRTVGGRFLVIFLLHFELN